MNFFVPIKIKFTQFLRLVFVLIAIVLVSPEFCVSAQSSLDYDCFIPENAGDLKKLPVLVCLPSAGQAEMEYWKLSAEKYGFVVLWPHVDIEKIRKIMGLKSLNRQIREIIKQTACDHAADSKRVFIAGTSVGGMLALSLSLMFPDQYVAAGVIRGARLVLVTPRSLENAGKCRFYFVHGQGDPSISVKEYYETKWQLKKRGAFIEEDVNPGYAPLSGSDYDKVVAWFSEM